MGKHVRGHSLIRQGPEDSRPARFDDDLVRLPTGATYGRVMCKCGVMSEPGLSQFGATSWHRDHKLRVDGTHVTVPLAALRALVEYADHARWMRDQELVTTSEEQQVSDREFADLVDALHVTGIRSA